MAVKSNREREQDGLELEEHHTSPIPMSSQDTTEAQDRHHDCDQGAMTPSFRAEPDALAVEPTASRTRSASNGDSASWIKKLEKWWVRYVRPTLDHEEGDPRDFLGTCYRQLSWDLSFTRSLIASLHVVNIDFNTPDYLSVCL
jgi:hypothetical protein